MPTENADRAAMPAAEPQPASPSAPARSSFEWGYVYAAIGALLFSTKAIAVKLAYADPVDAITLLAVRMAFAAPVYLVIGAFAFVELRRRGTRFPRPAKLIYTALIGALGYWLTALLDYTGLMYISAQFERLILFTYPLFTVIFGAMFFGQPMRRTTLAAVAISYLGIAVIFVEKVGTAGSNATFGAVLILICALAFAFYLLLAKPLIAELGPQLFTCVAMTGAAIATFVTFLVTHPVSNLVVGPRTLGYSIFLAVGPTLLTSFLISAALHRISSQANATIGTLSPVVTILLAVVILGETMTVNDLIGAALVMTGVGWFTFADSRSLRRPA